MQVNLTDVIYSKTKWKYKSKWEKYVSGGRTELKKPASGEYLQKRFRSAQKIAGRCRKTEYTTFTLFNSSKLKTAGLSSAYYFCETAVLSQLKGLAFVFR